MREEISVRLWKQIIAHLETLQKQVASIGNTYKTETQKSSPPPTLVPIEIRLSEELKRQQTTSDNARQRLEQSQFRRDWIRLLVETLALLGVAFTVYFTYSQSTEMRKQTDAIISTLDQVKKQTQSMTEQNKLMSTQLEASIGAVVDFSRFEFTARRDGLTIAIVNHGGTVATDVTIAVDISLRQIPSNTVVRRFSLPVDSIPALPAAPQFMIIPGLQVPQTEVGRQVRTYGYLLPTKERDEVEGGSLAIAAEASIAYNNGFRELQVRSCYAFFGTTIRISEKDLYQPRTTIPCQQLTANLIEFEESKREMLRRQHEAQGQQPSK